MNARLDHLGVTGETRARVLDLMEGIEAGALAAAAAKRAERGEDQ